MLNKILVSSTSKVVSTSKGHSSTRIGIRQSRQGLCRTALALEVRHRSVQRSIPLRISQSNASTPTPANRQANPVISAPAP